MRRRSRGSALLIAVVALLVLSVLGVGIVRYGFREVVGASALEREQMMVACSEAARQLLASRFHALGTDPGSLEAFDVELSEGVRALGGHYGDADPVGDSGAAVRITQVKALPLNAFGPAASSRDLTNVIAKDAVAKTPFKVVVRCQRTVGGNTVEQEMEFGVKFGL